MTGTLTSLTIAPWTKQQTLTVPVCHWGQVAPRQSFPQYAGEETSTLPISANSAEPFKEHR